MAKGYHRRNLGGGNVLKAVTRAKRRSPAGKSGRAPGRVPGPARWRVHERRLQQAAIAAMTEIEEGS